jgi:hypothetical protein
MIYILIFSSIPYFLSLFLCDFSSPSAVGLVILSSMPMILPWRVLTKRSNQWIVYRNIFPNRLNWIISLGILSALINVGLCAYAGGFDITSRNIIQSVSEAGSYNAVKRYTEGTDPSNSILLMLTFNALIISSIYGKLLKVAQLVLCIGLQTTLTLAKWPLYIAVAIIAAGYISISPSCGFFIIASRANNKFQQATAISIFLAVVMTIAGFVVFAIFLRLDMKELELSAVMKNVNSYVLNQYCNYSYWYEKIYEPSASPIFSSFFPGPASLLGGERLQGVYEQTITMNDADSNIFTVNRGLIETFTLLGPLIISSFAAVIITYLRTRHMLKILVIILNMTLISCFLGINCSIFKDNSVWLSVLTASITLIKFPPLASNQR